MSLLYILPHSASREKKLAFLCISNLDSTIDIALFSPCARPSHGDFVSDRPLPKQIQFVLVAPTYCDGRIAPSWVWLYRNVVLARLQVYFFRYAVCTQKNLAPFLSDYSNASHA